MSPYEQLLLCKTIRSQVVFSFETLTSLVEKPFLVDDLHQELVEAQQALQKAKKHLDKVVD